MKKILLLSLVSFMLFGCVSLKYRYKDQNAQTKAKQEKQQILNEQSSTYTAALDFIRRHRDPQLQVDSTDKDFIRSLQPTFSGSAEEAATALYYIKKSITDETTDLEAVTQKDRFDFLSVLNNNQILASNQLSALALLSAKKSSNPESNFNNQINKIVNNRASFWNRISSKSGQDRDATAHVPYDPNVSTTSTTEEVGAIGENYGDTSTTITGIDTNDDEALFLSGEDDFNADRYREAILKLEQVPESSQYYAKARTILKNISNKIVPSLRSKAASAYQNSLPVTEPGLKKTYLVEAKKYLEEAMNTYKYSDENALLKDNLAVIDRELDSIMSH